MNRSDKIENVSDEQKDDSADRFSSIAGRNEEDVAQKYNLVEFAEIVLLVFVAYSIGLWLGGYYHSNEYAKQLHLYRSTMIDLTENLDNFREENISQTRIMFNAFDKIFHSVDEINRVVTTDCTLPYSDISSVVHTPIDDLIEKPLDAVINIDRRIF